MLSPGAGNSGNPKKLGTARSWMFNIDQDFWTTDNFLAPWKTWNPLPKAWTFEITGLLDMTDDTPWQAVLASQPGTNAAVSLLYMYPVATNGSRFYSGFCWPRIRVEGNIVAPTNYILVGQGQGALNEN